MAILFPWMRAQGAWIHAHKYELPALHHVEVPPELRQWCALAGGLALILSREGPQDLPSRYPTARVVFKTARRCLQSGQAPRISGKLLRLLAEEIEAVADPLTKAACRACMRPARSGSGSGTDTGTLNTTESTQGGLMDTSMDLDDPVTVLSADVFTARSEVLRQTLAGARGAGKVSD